MYIYNYLAKADTVDPERLSNELYLFLKADICCLKIAFFVTNKVFFDFVG